SKAFPGLVDARGGRGRVASASPRSHSALQDVSGIRGRLVYQTLRPVVPEARTGAAVLGCLRSCFLQVRSSNRRVQGSFGFDQPQDVCNWIRGPYRIRSREILVLDAASETRPDSCWPGDPIPQITGLPPVIATVEPETY